MLGGRPLGMDNYLLRADLIAFAARHPLPYAAEGGEVYVQVGFHFIGVGDHEYRPRRVVTGEIGDDLGDARCGLLVGDHDQVEDARTRT